MLLLKYLMLQHNQLSKVKGQLLYIFEIVVRHFLLYWSVNFEMMDRIILQNPKSKIQNYPNPFLKTILTDHYYIV
jgi:hypothetical protein